MGSTHKTIYFPDLEMIRIPLPPLPEQRSAVDEIRGRSAVVHGGREAIGSSMVLIEERKRALITACVTGTFDVSTAGHRAAEAALQGVAG
jgi:type I restriction enzyme S subunit